MKFRVAAVPLLLAAVLLVLVLPMIAGKQEKKMHTVEIRSYNLKPGTRAQFHKVATEQAIPMLKEANIDVVANGPTLHEENSYFLIRRFDSLEDRQKKEDAFYNSEKWKHGPRKAILACIDNYTTIVIQVDDATLAGLRNSVTGKRL